MQGVAAASPERKISALQKYTRTAASTMIISTETVEGTYFSKFSRLRPAVKRTSSEISRMESLLSFRFWRISFSSSSRIAFSVSLE